MEYISLYLLNYNTGSLKFDIGFVRKLQLIRDSGNIELKH